MTEGPFQTKPLKGSDVGETPRPELHHVLDALRINNVELASQLLARVCKAAVRRVAEESIPTNWCGPPLRMQFMEEFDLASALSVHVTERSVWFKLERDCTKEVEGAFESFLRCMETGLDWSRAQKYVMLLDALYMKIEERGFGFWSITWKQRVANQ